MMAGAFDTVRFFPATLDMLSGDIRAFFADAYSDGIMSAWIHASDLQSVFRSIRYDELMQNTHLLDIGECIFGLEQMVYLVNRREHAQNHDLQESIERMIAETKQMCMEYQHHELMKRTANDNKS